MTIADIKPGCYAEPPPAPDWYKLAMPDQPLKRTWFCPHCREYHEFADVPFEVQGDAVATV